MLEVVILLKLQSLANLHFSILSQLANVLEISLQLVQNAISVYCRLGFAKKKYWDKPPEGLHTSWNEASLDRKK